MRKVTCGDIVKVGNNYYEVIYFEDNGNTAILKRGGAIEEVPSEGLVAIGKTIHIGGCCHPDWNIEYNWRTSTKTVPPCKHCYGFKVAEEAYRQDGTAINLGEIEFIFPRVVSNANCVGAICLDCILEVAATGGVDVHID